MIPDEAVEAAAHALFEKELGRPMEVADEPLYSEDIQACREDARAALEAAAPHIAAQALRDAVGAFPLETITAPDNAVVWLIRRAEQIEPT